MSLLPHAICYLGSAAIVTTSLARLDTMATDTYAMNSLLSKGISLNTPPEELSGGYKRRLALAVQLVCAPWYECVLSLQALVIYSSL